MTALLSVYLLSLVNFLAAVDVTQHASWHLLDHEGCGSSLTDRIIGGTAAGIGQFPWMVRIGYRKPYPFFTKNTAFKCGGSLINNLYVVTAAHCVTDLGGQIIELVRLGEHNDQTEVDCERDVCAPPVQDFKPSRVYYHKKYQEPEMRNDIGLIRLDRTAKLSEFVGPICLPYGPLLTKDYLGAIMEVAGWGVNDMEIKRTSSVLQHVRVPIVNPTECNEALGRYARMGPGQLCAGGQIGHDSCGGDSGGPLMKPEAVDGPPQIFLIGIVSFGSTKCGSNAPAVYTDVGHYVEWILDHLEP